MITLPSLQHSRSDQDKVHYLHYTIVGQIRIKLYNPHYNIVSQIRIGYITFITI